jgi:hypothetical protein
MREENKKDDRPRKEKKKGKHYYGNDEGWQPQRTGA